MKRALIAILAILGCLTPLFAQQGARQLFFEGENRFANDSYEAALDRYGELVERHPDSRYVPDAQFRRALAHYHLREYEEAIILLDRVERRFRSTQFLDAVPFWKGLSHYYAGNLPDAGTELTRFLEGADLGERGYQAHLYRGIVRSREGEATGAAEDLNAAAEAERPEIAGYARALWAQLLHREEKFEALVAAYERELWGEEALGEWISEVLFYVGDAYFELRRLPEAEEVLATTDPGPEEQELTAAIYQRRFTIAQRLNREVRPILREAEERLAGAVEVLQDFWLQVGVERYRQGSMDLAEYYFRRVWELRDRTTIGGEAPLYLSRILLREGDQEGAEGILQEARNLGLEPREEIAIALAGLYVEQGKLTEAQPLLEGLLEGGSFREPEVRYRLAFVYYNRGNYEQALDLIDETFSEGLAGGESANLLRIRSRALRDLGRYREALRVIREYLALEPGDPGARFEYVTLLFRLGEYQRLLEELEGSEDTLSGADADYLRGLAQVGLGRYEEAVETLTGLEGSETLEPYREYYLAWARYRLGRNSSALEDFDRISRERTSPFAAKAAYLGGWSAYVIGSYDRAVELLRRVSSFDTTMETREDAWRLLAESYRAAGEPGEALAVYRTILAEAERTEVIAEAWLSYALLLEELGRSREAAEELAALNGQFPGTRQGERALYEEGRLLFESGSHEAARERFLEYRREYPRGDFGDSALYQEGNTLVAQGESAGAILVWERFLEEFGESPLSYEVKRSLAPLYVERGELRKAYNLYGELLAAFPERAREDELEQRREEISLRLQGLTDREAGLWARIENLDAGSEERGEAILELARIVVYEGGAPGPRRELLVGYLRELGEGDGPRAPRANFLLGEYYAGREEYDRAIDAYLSAAEEAGRDLTGRSLFRAAQMYGAEGDRDAVRAIVSRIEEELPESTWADEARRLLGGER
ncbi:MAG: tetratricopeptide repeat protein [Spirochaetaceae bacterium]